MYRSRVFLAAATAVVLLISVVAMRADDAQVRTESHEQPQVAQLLAADLALLLQDYGPDHPKVRRVRYQLDYLREQQNQKLPPAHYSLAASSSAFVMADTASGATWLLDLSQGTDKATWKLLPALPNP